MVHQRPIMSLLFEFTGGPLTSVFMTLLMLYILWTMLLWASPIFVFFFAFWMFFVKAFLWGVIWVLVVVYLVMKIYEVYSHLP
ncbi:uncharacterized protein EAF02_005141 [Botrytis sinoallii]|uniref:uncharacterized protein n=1 Tax=Botrytis sinoallii TaxID=1463999 RepID=UPI001901EC8B|nr:uncharacterized protein EAF02_005141 [Botrytis sinoallii]KAF7883221.1 hypothetical protein EAF02_005141 [Botrytis sinoallii]